MSPLTNKIVRKYINQHFSNRQSANVKALHDLNLENLLNGNPFYLSLKPPASVGSIIETMLTSYFDELDKSHINAFLKGLATVIAEQEYGATISSISGFDFEFQSKNIYYVVCINSQPDNFQNINVPETATDLAFAVQHLSEINNGMDIQAVIGCPFGKLKTRYEDGYLKVAGQNFWYLISGQLDLYKELFDVINVSDNDHNSSFRYQKAGKSNLLSLEFFERFCTETGSIDWQKLVEFNSGNFDLDSFLPE